MGAGFQIQPQAVSDTTGDIESILSRTGQVISDLGGTVLDGGTFAGIGGDVAAANAALHSDLVDSLGQVRDLLTSVNGDIDQSNQGYQLADSSTATSFGGDPGTTTAADATTTATGTGTTQAADMTTDQDLRDQLAQEEGDRQHVYVDTAGHPSVGIGFNLDRSDARSQLASVGADYDAVRAGTQDLTQGQIDQLFQHDVSTAVSTAQNYYSGFDQLDPTRQRVLTDMAFNLGPTRLAGFQNLHTALVNGDWNAAANEMQNSAWATQVGDRATNLINQMRTGR
jgi:GH24 family phage-related lysozyme (muramidase)